MIAKVGVEKLYCFIRTDVSTIYFQNIQKAGISF
jgi:hypothetical protein